MLFCGELRFFDFPTILCSARRSSEERIHSESVGARRLSPRAATHRSWRTSVRRGGRVSVFVRVLLAPTCNAWLPLVGSFSCFFSFFAFLFVYRVLLFLKSTARHYEIMQFALGQFKKARTCTRSCLLQCIQKNHRVPVVTYGTLGPARLPFSRSSRTGHR